MSVTLKPTLFLRFADPRLEASYQERFRTKHWVQNAIAAVLGLLLYSIFGLVDWQVLPQGHEKLWTIRFLYSMPAVLAVFGLLLIPGVGRRYSGLILFFAMLISGTAIVVMNLYMPPNYENFYFTGLLLVMIFGHVLWRAGFIWPTSASALLLVVYLGLTESIRPLPPAQLASSLFYYLAAFFMNAYAGWFFEWQERRSFLLQYELQHAASTDPLTGIANRRAFVDHFEREWRRAQRDGSMVCLLLVDLDNLKKINDTGGHAMGDEALRRVAGKLAAQARRPGDLAARLGGDEFALLLTGSHGGAACELAYRIAAEMEPVVQEDSALVHLATVSVGMVCKVPGVDDTHETCFQEADRLLYEAKRQGKGRAVCCVADGANC